MKYVLLCPVCLAVAALFIQQEHRENYKAAVGLKGLASLCFVLLGVLGARLSGNAQLARLAVIGLVLGCAADVLLNLRFVAGKYGQPVFLLGILVFLSGHVLYLAAVLPLCRRPLLCVLAAVVLTALLMAWIFRRITAKPAFKIFGVVYIGAIVLLNCVALGNLLSAPSAFTGTFLAGALLFLVSDIVLILNTFGPESRFGLRVTNLSLYYVGQLLIALSLQMI